MVNPQILLLAIVVILVILLAYYAGKEYQKRHKSGDKAEHLHRGGYRGGRRRGMHGFPRRSRWSGYLGRHAQPSWWRWGSWPGDADYPWGYWSKYYPEIYAYMKLYYPQLMTMLINPSICDLCPYICKALGGEVCNQCTAVC